MNLKDSAKLLNVLMANYPDTRKQMSDEMLEATVRLWAMAFEKESYQEMLAGALAYISTDTNAFMPNVGQMREKLEQLKNPEADDTGMEAWEHIKKACGNALYNAEAEFEKLSELEKRIVRSPSTLRDYALMDSETFNSVTMSHVLKAARIENQRIKDIARLPESVRALFQFKEIPDQIEVKS